MSENQLSELEQDAITELVNIGMGRGAKSLSELLDQEVLLSVPSLQIVPRTQLMQIVRNQHGDQLSCVQQHFKGEFSGKALLLFPQEHSHRIVESLFAKNKITTAGDQSSAEKDALTEIGNILINACLGSIGDILKNYLKTGQAVYLEGQSEQILQISTALSEQSTEVMIIHLDMQLTEIEISGNLVFLLAFGSLKTLKKLVSSMI